MLLIQFNPGFSRLGSGNEMLKYFRIRDSTVKPIIRNISPAQRLLARALHRKCNIYVITNLKLYIVSGLAACKAFLSLLVKLIIT